MDAQAPIDEHAAERAAMVAQQIERRGVRDPRVLDAMREVPRHELVPGEVAAWAYEDMPLPIGGGKTISQPYIVGVMTELATIRPGARVLEIGTGSGYQTAVLAAMGADVYSIEIDERLAALAAEALPRVGYRAHLRQGDGYPGWPEAAPFAAILVTAAPPHVPDPLLAQLAVGGRLVIPVGDRRQELLVITRTDESGWTTEHVFPVAFIPMTGAAQAPRVRH
jgi:protein-L-isoaspartate(D-aspartate) O-methyltransferase